MSKKHKKHHHPHPPKAAAEPARPQVVDPADLRTEPPEPTTQRGSIPVLLIVFMVFLFYLADMYVVSHGADLGGKGGAFPNQVYEPYFSYTDVDKANPKNPEQEMFELGRRLYSTIGCVTCHGPGGAGVPGQFPPLAGSDWVLAESPARIIRIVQNGFMGPVTVSGGAFNNAMPPLGPSLGEDKNVAAVLTYVRKEWGNKGSAVTPEQVAKVRKEITKPDAFTAAELEQIPVTGQ